MSAHEETEESDFKFETSGEVQNTQPKDVLQEGEGGRRPRWALQPADPSYINAIIYGFSSEDPILLEEACLKLLSPRLSLPSALYTVLDSVVEASLVPKLIGLLNHESPPLQRAIAWVIATLARTEPKLIMDKGGMDKLIPLLAHKSSHLSEPAAHSLCSLASANGGSDKRLFVNELREAGVILVLVEVIKKALAESKLNKPHLLALMKLAKAICYVPKNVRITADRMTMLETLCEALLAVEDSDVEILYHTCWALYYLTKSGNEEVIGRVVQMGVVPSLVRCSSNAYPKLMKPTLNVLGNIISSSVDGHTDAVLFAGGLPHLKPLMLEPQWTGEVNWIVSNIAAGSEAQKEALFQGGFFSAVLDVLKLDTISGPKEAIFTIINVMDKGTVEQKRFFVDNGLLQILATLLKNHASDVLTPVVDAVYLFVKAFHHGSRVYMDEMGESDWLQKLLNETDILQELSKFQDDEFEEICERVGYILDVGNNNEIEY